MSTEGFHLSKKTNEKEAPMVSVHDNGEFVPLNEEGEIKLRKLNEKERTQLRKVISGISARNIAAAASLAATAYGTAEAIEDIPGATFTQEKASLATAPKNEALQKAIKQLNPEVYEMADGSHYTTKPRIRPWQERGEESDLVSSWYENYVTEESPLYDRYVETIAQEKTMSRTQAMFMTKDGQLLQGPTDLTDSAGYTPYDMTISYKEGSPVGIPPVWSAPIKKKLSERYKVPVNTIEMRHVYQALSGKKVESLKGLVVERMLELEEQEGESVLELIKNNFYFLPSSLQEKPAERLYIEARLRDILPAQIAKESLYNTQALSVAGAKGPLQIMPETWNKYAAEDMKIESLKDSLIIAGKYYAAAYEYLINKLEKEFAVIEREYFNGDHQAFLEHFLIMVLVNDYNAGDGNMQKVIKWFVTNYPTLDKLQEIFPNQTLKNKDIFFVFAQLAAQSDTGSQYKNQAGLYNKEISGWQIALEDGSKRVLLAQSE